MGQAGSELVVQLLLEAGAGKLVLMKDFDLKLPLHYASEAGCPVSVQVLLGHVGRKQHSSNESNGSLTTPRLRMFGKHLGVAEP